MRTGRYARCPYCGKNYQTVIPKGGDGSAEFLPFHRISIPYTNNLGITILPGKKLTCKGSHQIVEQKQNDR